MYRRNKGPATQAAPQAQAAFQRAPGQQQGRSEMNRYSGPDARPAGDPGQEQGGGAQNIRAMLTRKPPQQVQPPQLPPQQGMPPAPAPGPVAQPAPMPPAPGPGPVAQPMPMPPAPKPYAQPQPMPQPYTQPPTSGIQALRQGVQQRLMPSR